MRANMIGCIVFAALITALGPALNIIEPSAFGTLANSLLPFSEITIFGSAIIAGWLMGLVTWLVSASLDTIGQIFVVWVLKMAIGFDPFHHCILGTTEVLSALFLGQDITFSTFTHFLGWTTLGNILGGSVFIALLNYGQSAKAGSPKDVDVADE